ncbi:MAG TPA: PLP-dependent lyase/thiolase [Kiritimatiellia bacterium]|nr:PLP-dependent lyase/thiolase [Kiritimatiellia bacterium]HMP33356.1 PLP-dependent lyase/thiolase [Kiritimatiellia bacterium]
MFRVLQLCGVSLIDESCQVAGSFKSRGVACQLRAFARLEYWRPIITFTSGNHGLAVALYARRGGQAPTIIVPDWVEHDKRLLLERLGCNVIMAGLTASECERHALDVCADVGGFMAHPYRSRDQIVGYSSLWSEIARTFPDGADIVVPVGSGGLLAAGVLYRRQTNARYHIIGVEPSRCPSLAQTLSGGVAFPVAGRSLAAPALNVDTTPDEILAIIESMEGVDLCQVTEVEIEIATNYLHAHGHAVDPAAGTAFAAAVFRSIPRHNKHLVVILTGASAKRNLARMEAEGRLSASISEITRTIGKPGEMRRYDLSVPPEPCVSSAISEAQLA